MHEGEERAVPPGEVTRRRFLTAGMGVIGGVLGLGYLGMGLKYMFPPAPMMRTPWQEVGLVKDFTISDAKLVPMLYQGHRDGVWVLKWSDSYDHQFSGKRLAACTQPALSGKAATAERYDHTNSNQFSVYDMHCPHLHCPFASTGTGFACPCHGSQYTLDGCHIAGPAPHGLYLHSWKVEAGKLYVAGIYGYVGTHMGDQNA